MNPVKILENPRIWKFFRKILDVFFGLYRKRFAVIQSFGVNQNTSVLDVACGTGQYSAITKGPYLGVDLERRYIDFAKKSYGDAGHQFLCADANDPQAVGGSYDTAILIDATHHLTDAENRRLIGSLNRIASRSVIICDPVRQRPANLIGRFLTAIDRGKHIRPKEDLLRLISETLRIEKVVDLRMISIDGICVLARPRK